MLPTFCIKLNDQYRSGHQARYLHFENNINKNRYLIKDSAMFQYSTMLLLFVFHLLLSLFRSSRKSTLDGTRLG